MKQDCESDYYAMHRAENRRIATVQQPFGEVDKDDTQKKPAKKRKLDRYSLYNKDDDHEGHHDH
jgi:hypothetical protein